MPARGKTGSGKSSSKKTGRKKASKKKTLKKTSAPRKKSAVKKKAAKKAAAKRTAGKRTTREGSKIIQKTIDIKPGPPSLSVPPVEEPAQNEEAIGTVTHYYSHLGVAVVQVNKGAIRTGDTVRFKGHTTDFTQKVESMEYEHQHTDQAIAGQSVGLKVTDHVREHDILYRMK